MHMLKDWLFTTGNIQLDNGSFMFASWVNGLFHDVKAGDMANVGLLE